MTTPTEKHMEPELDNDGLLLLENPHDNTGDIYYDIFCGWHSRFKIPVSSASWAIVFFAEALSNGRMLSKKTLAIKDQPIAIGAKGP